MTTIRPASADDTGVVTAIVQEAFGVYVGLEAEACALRAFEDQVVHGLLQTEEYARAGMTAASTA